jgi:hypothetical protein
MKRLIGAIVWPVLMAWGWLAELVRPRNKGGLK